jgi:hypothetical protein
MGSQAVTRPRWRTEAVRALEETRSPASSACRGQLQAACPGSSSARDPAKDHQFRDATRVPPRSPQAPRVNALPAGQMPELRRRRAGHEPRGKVATVWRPGRGLGRVGPCHGREGSRVRLIITDSEGDAWGRLEPETSAEIVALEQSAARGDWTTGRGTGAITGLRALAARLGYPVRETEERHPPAASPPRLVVVQRGEAALAEQLRSIVGPGVPVIWDRRVRDRRTAGHAASVDRRRRNRRGLQSATWGTLRFIVLRATDPTP